MLPALKHWFDRLRALITRIESDKGSNRVIAELACDSALMFRNSHEFLSFCDVKGIVLLSSPPCTQKLNAVVERPIRTVLEMAIAMSRHGNVPKRFMGCAMRLASKLLNRLFKKMSDGTRDVPLWRYKGIKVPLHLDRFHPYGCEFQALVPKKFQTKFGAKTIRTIFLDYDFSSMCYIVAVLPHMALKQTAHGVFNDMSFPLRDAASVTNSWGVDVTYDPACPDPLAPWLGDAQMELDLTQVPREPRPQLPMENLAAIYPENEGSHVPANAQSVSVPVEPVPAGVAGPRRSLRGWQPSRSALEKPR